jgi:hypothetical protein
MSTQLVQRRYRHKHLSRWTFTAAGEGLVAIWTDDRLLAVWQPVFTRVVLGVEKLSLGANVLCGNLKNYND